MRTEDLIALDPSWWYDAAILFLTRWIVWGARAPPFVLAVKSVNPLAFIVVKVEEIGGKVPRGVGRLATDLFIGGTGASFLYLAKTLRSRLVTCFRGQVGSVYTLRRFLVVEWKNNKLCISPRRCFDWRQRVAPFAFHPLLSSYTSRLLFFFSFPSPFWLPPNRGLPYLPTKMSRPFYQQPDRIIFLFASILAVASVIAAAPTKRCEYQKSNNFAFVFVCWLEEDIVVLENSFLISLVNRLNEQLVAGVNHRVLTRREKVSGWFVTWCSPTFALPSGRARCTNVLSPFANSCVLRRAVRIFDWFKEKTNTNTKGRNDDDDDSSAWDAQSRPKGRNGREEEEEACNSTSAFHLALSVLILLHVISKEKKKKTRFIGMLDGATEIVIRRRHVLNDSGSYKIAAGRRECQALWNWRENLIV